MIVLLGIGFVAGLITAISPCVLPVLPIILAGGATGGKRRPYAIIAGLVVSFTMFTLTAAWLLDRLGLPQDFLRNVAIVMLFLLAATLVFPKLNAIAERPFLRLGRRKPGGDLGGGFLLGLSLGLVFVPCAGPVLTVVTVVAASRQVDLEAVLLTVAYAAGAAVPMLAIALGSQRFAQRLRSRGQTLRIGMGALLALTALAIVFKVDTRFQTALPGYTNALQKRFESSDTARKRLRDVSGRKERSPATEGGRSELTAAGTPALDDFGAAPEIRGISHWLNTPGERPLTLKRLRGKVVLIDFWTYSCINCLRTLPHVKAWYAAYRPKGLVVIGVHTPEFAFEHELGNVRKATKDLGVHYPVALDNRYATWNAYANEYWPAEYLIDRSGHVRHTHFGEGEYEETEALIRRLLGEGKGASRRAAAVADETPTHNVTPESYLGYARLARYAGSPIKEDREATYRFPRTLLGSELAYGGRWRVRAEHIVAGKDARLRLNFHARNVYLVLGGRGSVRVLVDGKPRRRLTVSGDKLYTLVHGAAVRDGLLELRFTPGVSAYAFTFG